MFASATAAGSTYRFRTMSISCVIEAVDHENATFFWWVRVIGTYWSFSP